METNHQTKILAAMMQPGFYPHAVDSIQRRETHISTVFLTGSLAYKIKKPVDMGFLDFTSLEKRHYYCLQEIALNRRLSSGVYIDAVPVTLQAGTYSLNGSGTTVEFAVKMKQLAATDAMQQRLQHAGLDGRHIERLVRLLVDFYARAATDSAMDTDDALAWEDNLQLTEAFAGVWIDRPQFEFVRSASRSFYRRHQRLFEQRRKDGKIKDCHGDLRTDHIYFTENGIQIIDCIEFNRRLRYLDVINDLAFLAMDLEYRDSPETAATLIRLYVEQADDAGALPLLDFYRCYRAMVRCKVNCLRLRETGLDRKDRDALRAAAEDYLAMAHAYAAAFNRPTLWVVCGLPASGKSTLAAALAEVFDIGLIRSDVIRKRLFDAPPGRSGDLAFEEGLYSAQATEATYERMFDLAGEDLKKGQGVVIDATFSRWPRRAQALRIAVQRNARPVFVECRADEAILAARLQQRETEPSVSDARLIHLKAFIKRYDPMDRIGDEIHIPVDTSDSPADCLRLILLSDSLWNRLNRKGGKHV